jgi:hypothetical protein
MRKVLTKAARRGYNSPLEWLELSKQNKRTLSAWVLPSSEVNEHD